MRAWKIHLQRRAGEINACIFIITPDEPKVTEGSKFKTGSHGVQVATGEVSISCGDGDIRDDIREVPHFYEFSDQMLKHGSVTI